MRKYLINDNKKRNVKKNKQDSKLYKEKFNKYPYKEHVSPLFNQISVYTLGYVSRIINLIVIRLYSRELLYLGHSKWDMSTIFPMSWLSIGLLREQWASGPGGVSAELVEPSRTGFLLHCNAHKSMTIKIHFVCVDLLRLFDLPRR